MINDDLACEASSYGVIRECGLDRILDRADSQSAAVIVACTEAYNKKLILADLILISCVIHGSISCIVILFVIFLSSDRLRCGSFLSSCLCGCSSLRCG